MVILVLRVYVSPLEMRWGAQMEISSIPCFDRTSKRLKGLLLLTGPPGSGKTTLCKYFIANHLSKRRASIYISTDEEPSSLESSLRKYRYSPRRHDLRIIDCYSWRIEKNPNTRFKAVDSSNLTELSIMISKTYKDIQNYSFVLDSS